MLYRCADQNCSTCDYQSSATTGSTLCTQCISGYQLNDDKTCTLIVETEDSNEDSEEPDEGVMT